MFTTNNPIDNLKVWMGQALSWLHQGDNQQQVLQKHYQQLLDMMSSARTANRTSDVWEVVDELERLASQMSPAEQGEVFLRCAVMAVDLENLKDALRLLQGARNKSLTSNHQNAVVLWMSGCIYWMNHQRVEGISDWQAGIQAFRACGSNNRMDPARNGWYTLKIQELESYLAEAIRIGGLPRFLGTVETPEAQTPPPAATNSSRESDALRWVSCPVSEDVPAGGFGPTGFDTNPRGFLEISEVLIDDEPYTIHNVHRTSPRRSTVNISSQSQYHTVHIIGTSMNAAIPVPIDSGDYVLIVAPQSEVGDNEIVVASIVGQDERATVKRLSRRNGRIQLKPESSDESNYEIDWEKEYDEKSDDEFKIIGVVKAVLKKKS